MFRDRLLTFAIMSQLYSFRRTDGKDDAGRLCGEAPVGEVIEGFSDRGI